MGLDAGRACAKWYPAISVVRSGLDGGEQHQEGLTVAGGAAPSRGGEVAGVRAGVSYVDSVGRRSWPKAKGKAWRTHW
jgi:hypothetical protein